MLAIALTTAIPAVLVALALRVLINKPSSTLKVQSPATKIVPAAELVEILPPYEENTTTAIVAVSAFEPAEPMPAVPDEIPAPTVTEDVDQISPLPQTLDNITIDESLFEQTAEFEADEPLAEEPLAEEIDGSTAAPDNDQIDIEANIASSLDQQPATDQPQEMEPLFPAAEEVEQSAESQTTRDDDYYVSILADRRR